MATIEGQTHQAITFIGQAHLLDGHPWRCESHLLSTTGNFVGKELAIELLHMIRPSLPFISEAQAHDAIQSDVQAARAYFNERS